MTVSTQSLPDGSPKPLVQQSVAAPGAGGRPPLTPSPLEALRTMLQTPLQKTLHDEFFRFLGAAPFERTTARTGVRNGTRARTLVTRVGKLVLEVPRDRASLFTPNVFQRYQRHEQALVSTLAECYLQDVSTRKVREIVETLCGETVSASTVCRATKQLDATLAAWRTRRLEAQAYPQLVIDAHYERMRREGQVFSTAVLWVMGVAANGYREYHRVWLGTAESGPAWSRMFKDLHQRGLHGVQYVVSDEHAGLNAAVQRYFPDAARQRCQVHYLRSALTKVSTPARQATLLAALRDVWAAPTRPEAPERGRHLVLTLLQPLSAVAAWLEERRSTTRWAATR